MDNNLINIKYNKLIYLFNLLTDHYIRSDFDLRISTYVLISNLIALDNESRFIGDLINLRFQAFLIILQYRDIDNRTIYNNLNSIITDFIYNTDATTLNNYQYIIYEKILNFNDIVEAFLLLEEF